MNSLLLVEQAAKAIFDELHNDGCPFEDSARLAIIQKHLDAFAREQNRTLQLTLDIEKANHPFFKQLTGDFEEALGPHPQIDNGMWIQRIKEIREERDKLKEQNRELEELVQIQAGRPQMTNENLVEVDQLRRANRELLKDLQAFVIMVDHGMLTFPKHHSGQVYYTLDSAKKALDKAALAKGDV